MGMIGYERVNKLEKGGGRRDDRVFNECNGVGGDVMFPIIR